jgi:membrane protein
MRVRKRSLFQKFFADRGTHLAAMIAYFALLSLVPMLFLALSLLGFIGQQGQENSLVSALKHIFPGNSVGSIKTAVERIQDSATALGIIGGAVLLWSSLSLFSVLESAFNIVYGRPNRSFLHGKALAFLLLVSSLVTLIASLLAGSLGVYLLRRFAGDFLGNPYIAYPLSAIVEFAGLLLFLVTAYYVLTNVQLKLRDVIPGAITAAAILAATFQILPFVLDNLVSHDLVVLRYLGGPVILLFWLYLMANVFVFGAEVNWWVAQRRQAQAIASPPPKPLATDGEVTAILEPEPKPQPDDAPASPGTEPTASDLR